MNVRGWGFSCQILLSFVQKVAVTVKLIFLQPAESQAKMLHRDPSSLFT